MIAACCTAKNVTCLKMSLFVRAALVWKQRQAYVGCIPVHFFVRKGVSGSGSCPILFRQMILRQYDNRASKSSKFNFIMFNQIQRHAAISTVAARAKSNPKSLLKFMSIVNADGCMDRLKAAVKAPDSNEAKIFDAVNSCVW